MLSLLVGLSILSATDLSPHSTDLTADYLRIYAAMQKEDLQTHVQEGLEEFHVLLVPGFLSGLIHSGQTIPDGSQANFEPYFAEARDWMKARDLSFQLLQPPTQMGSGVIAPLIRDAVLNAEKPVILISQSKGGLDILLALERFPEIRTKIHRWISIQSPFWGSPVADAVIENSWLKETVDYLLGRMGSSIEVVRELTTYERGRKNLEQLRFIRKLMREIPTLFLATFKKDEEGPDTFFEPVRNFLQKRGYLNDGVVPWHHAILPHSHYIVLQGLDHSSPVKQSANRTDLVDRVRLFLSLISLSNDLETDGRINYREARFSLAEHFAFD